MLDKAHNLGNGVDFVGKLKYSLQHEFEQNTVQAFVKMGNCLVLGVISL